MPSAIAVTESEEVFVARTGALAGDGLQAREQLALQLQVLRRGLDDQVAAGERVQLRGRAEPGERGDGLLGAPAPTLDPPLYPRGGPFDPLVQRLRVGIVKQRLHAAQDRDLGDPDPIVPAPTTLTAPTARELIARAAAPRSSQNGTESRS